MITVDTFKREHINQFGNYYSDTDYTGRWKISNGKLYIECFEVGMTEKKVHYKLVGKEPVYDSIWDRIRATPSRYVETITEMSKFVNKVRANVIWVDEDSLISYSETINTCSGDCE